MAYAADPLDVDPLVTGDWLRPPNAIGVVSTTESCAHPQNVLMLERHM